MRSNLFVHGNRGRNTYMSSTGLFTALVSCTAVSVLSCELVSLETSVLFCGVVLGGDDVALPRKTESLISASFRVSNAPLTVALSRSFCDKEEVMVTSPVPEDALLCKPSGCCLRNRLSARADFA